MSRRVPAPAPVRARESAFNRPANASAADAPSMVSPAVGTDADVARSLPSITRVRSFCKDTLDNDMADSASLVEGAPSELSGSLTCSASHAHSSTVTRSASVSARLRSTAWPVLADVATQTEHCETHSTPNATTQSCASTQTTGTVARPPLPHSHPAPISIRGASSSTNAHGDRRQRRRPHVVLCSSNRVLPAFAETTNHGVQNALMAALYHINSCGSGCCPYHITLARLVQTCKEAKATACGPQFKPVSGWQCASCTCVNEARDGDEDEEDSDGVCWACGDEEEHLDNGTYSSGNDGDKSSTRS